MPDPEGDSWVAEQNEFAKNYVKRHGQRIAVYIDSFEKLSGRNLFYTLTEGDFHKFIKRIDPELSQAVIDTAASINYLSFIHLTSQNPDKWKYVQEKDKKYVFAEIDLSKIAFNPAHDKGCFFYNFFPGPMAGHGELIFIKKVGRKWVIDKIEGLWVA